MILRLLLVLVVVFILAVVFGTISQFIYERKPIQEVRAGFKKSSNRAKPASLS
jgi:Na+-transporting methylmalonyl-CoA/oxaloacetate decarboxylase gamma subunit